MVEPSIGWLERGRERRPEGLSEERRLQKFSRPKKTPFDPPRVRERFPSLLGATVLTGESPRRLFCGVLRPTVGPAPFEWSKTDV